MVHTGDFLDAGTDGTVWVHLFGERGDTGVRRLTKSEATTNVFQRGKVLYSGNDFLVLDVKLCINSFTL